MIVIFKNVWLFFSRAVNTLEKSQAPLWYFGFTFLGAIILRTFLESFEGDNDPRIIAYIFLQFITTRPAFPVSWVITHYLLFYVALGLTLIGVLRLITKQPVISLFKIVTTGFLITIIVPIIDLLVSGGTGYRISYITPTSIEDIFFKFITLFGHSFNEGVSPGIRVELMIVIIATFLYARLKNLSVVKSIFTSLAVYVTIFTYFFIPSLEKLLFGQLFPTNLNNQTIIGDFVLLSAVLTVFLFALERTAFFVAVLRDIRLPRLLHYWLMFGIGILFLQKTHSAAALTYLSFQQSILLLTSIAAAWIYSVITNNMEDVEIDRISNPTRPLTSRAVEVQEYKVIGWIVLVIALSSAAVVGFNALFLVALFIGNYFMYSMPPLRIKRVPLFSKMTILLNSFVCFLLGVAIFNSQLSNATREMVFDLFTQLPTLGLIALPIAVFFALNFLDLKDHDGDAQAGIKTLPVLIGMKNAQIITGLSMLVAYVAAGSLFENQWILLGATGIGLVQYYLLTKKSYRELPVFIVYLTSLGLLFFIL